MFQSWLLRSLMAIVVLSLLLVPSSSSAVNIDTYEPDVLTASDDYRKRFCGKIGEWFLGRQAYFILRCLKLLPSDSKVLDVGGGHGQLVPYFIRSNYSITVMGSATEAGAQIVQYVSNNDCSYLVSSLTKFDFPDKSFDAVVSIRLLAHMENWREVVAEMCRVAKTSVVVDYSSKRSLNCLSNVLFGIKKLIEDKETTQQFIVFSDKELIEAFENSGFQLSDRLPQYFLPMAFHRLVGSATFSRSIEGFFEHIGLTRLLGSPIIASFSRAK